MKLLQLTILMTGLLLAACQTATTVNPNAPEPKDIGLADLRGTPPMETVTATDLDMFPGFFMDIAFNNDIRASDNRLIRWRYQTAKFVLVDAPHFDKSALSVVDGFSSRFREVTGVRLSRRFGSTVGRGEILVKFSPREEIARSFGVDKQGLPAACGGTTGAFEGQQNQRAAAIGFLYISESDWHPCLVEELSQVFGLHGDTDRFPGMTQFDDSPLGSSFDGGLRPWDWLALWVLFDPRLQPGMSREEAEPIVRTIVDELRERLAAG